MKKIIVSKETRQKLKEKHGCSEASVSLALNFRNDSLLSRQIRKEAFESRNCYMVDF